MMGKIPHEIFSFSIGYSIGQKYWPMCILVFILDLNQNSGFGHTLDIIALFDNRQLH